MNKKYDVIIIGGGPAGLSAGIYAARARLKAVMLEKAIMGGQIANAWQVDNYPGFVDGISGMDLTELMQKQAVKFGLEIVMAEASAIKVNRKNRIVTTDVGEFSAPAVIIAGGSARRKLEVSGEAEFSGRGVSYCAVCDGAFFKDKVVAVIGGGNVAISEALHLARFASKVIVVHRRDQLRADRIVAEKAMAEKNIEFRWDAIVSAIKGDDFVREMELKNVKSDKKTSEKLDGVFVAIGFKPETEFLKNVIDLDKSGSILTNEKMETSVPGIYACGDIRHNSARQAICASGDGAIAAIYATRYLNE